MLLLLIGYATFATISYTFAPNRQAPKGFTKPQVERIVDHVANCLAEMAYTGEPGLTFSGRVKVCSYYALSESR